MTRIFGYRLSVEMLLLWLVETGICFMLLFWVITGRLAVPDIESAGALNAAAVMAITIGLLGSALGLYRAENCLETRRLLLQTAVAALASLPTIWVVGKLVHLDIGALFDWARAWPLRMLCVWTLLLLGTRLILGQAVRKGMFTRGVVLLGREPANSRIAVAIGGLQRQQFRVAGVAESVPDVDRHAALTVPASLRLAVQGLLSGRVWGVVVDAEIAASLPDAVMQDWRRHGLQVLPEPAFWERHLGRVDPTPGRLDAVSPAASSLAARVLHRVLDIAGATALLLLTGPLMLVTALAIKLESPGPIFYRQQRVGLGGRAFTVIKFRSMRNDAEVNGPVWAARRDSRATRVGRFIRRVRIDELPQLLCIIQGNMSLVGPRPERPHFVDQLAEVIPRYRDRACVKPGLTGWAQVNFPYGASVEDARVKLSYDLYYVKHRSLMLDLMILLATVRVVLFQEGAR